MLSYRVVPLPPTWPGVPTPGHQRKPSPFKVNWSSTLALLDAEVRALRGRDVTLALAVRPEQIRIDGGVYASARIQAPEVILSLQAGADRLSFPCDRFNWWEDNVRAIGLAMEALRKVDRYGVQSGRQYQGFRALPSGAAPSGASAAPAVERIDPSSAIDDAMRPLTVAHARLMVRTARAKTHPDVRGHDRDFLEIQAAAESLSLYFNVPL